MWDRSHSVHYPLTGGFFLVSLLHNKQTNKHDLTPVLSPLNKSLNFSLALMENRSVTLNFSPPDHFGCNMATVKKRLKDYKAGIGKWNLTVAEKLEQTFQTMTAVKNNNKDSKYVPFGNLQMLSALLSQTLLPIFITGLSGNGKTFGVEQACSTEP